MIPEGAYRVYQVYQDGKITYDRTMEFFDAEPDWALEAEAGGRSRLRPTWR